MSDPAYDEDYWDEGLESLADEYKDLDELIESLKQLQIHTPVTTFIVDAIVRMVGADISTVEDINEAYAEACMLVIQSDFIHQADQVDMINLAEHTRDLCVQCFIATELETPLHYHITIQ